MNAPRLSMLNRRMGAVTAALVLACGLLVSILIVSLSPRYGITCVLVVAATVYVALNPPARRVWVLLLFITFPVMMQIAGRNAFSTGTLFIAVVFAVHWATSGRPAFVQDPVLTVILIALALIAVAGIIFGMPRAYWATGARRWVDLVSSIGAFLLILGWARACKANLRAYVEAAITALLFVAALHVVISLVLRQWPGIEQYLSVFLRREEGSLGILTAEGSYIRATTVFLQDEQFGEFLLLLFPLALYKLFTARLAVFLPLTILLSVGAMYTGTRSCLSLILLQVLVFFALLTFRQARSRYLRIGVAALLLAGASFALASSILDTALSRFARTAELWEQGSSVLAVLNRETAWSSAYPVVGNTLSWIGHGPVPAYAVGLGRFHFHSLYMTLIYEFGIIGTLVWVGFFAHLVRRMWQGLRTVRLKEDVGALLMSACFLSLIGFLVNEVKYEFNRTDSYQQVVWILFALFYVAAGAVGRSRPDSKWSVYEDPVDRPRTDR